MAEWAKNAVHRVIPLWWRRFLPALRGGFFARVLSDNMRDDHFGGVLVPILQSLTGARSPLLTLVCRAFSFAATIVRNIRFPTTRTKHGRRSETERLGGHTSISFQAGWKPCNSGGGGNNNFKRREKRTKFLNKRANNTIIVQLLYIAARTRTITTLTLSLYYPAVLTRRSTHAHRAPCRNTPSKQENANKAGAGGQLSYDGISKEIVYVHVRWDHPTHRCRFSLAGRRSITYCTPRASIPNP